MYLPPAFEETDPAEVRGLIEAAGAATLVTVVDGALFASTVPLLFEPDPGGDGPGRLVGHLARANPQARRSSAEVDALAVFNGVTGYVSPTLYPTKQDGGRVVPTWNYEVVHLWGPLVVHDDPAWVLDLVTRLTGHHEARYRQRGDAAGLPAMEPWAVADAPADFIDGQLRAIVGVEIPVTRLAAKRKLSQNRPEADRAGVLAGFSARAAAGVSGAAAMAARVRQANPGS
ncbi:MAG: FMN-binding negative transcriptional regulator [Acidimicrobiales bacterium]